MNDYCSLLWKYLARAEIWNKELIFLHFFIHNLCVLNSNMLDNFLYLVIFTFELAKDKMATKMFSEPRFSMVSRTRQHNL